MGNSALLAIVFVLATTSVVGQIATGIRLVGVRFGGDTRLQAADLKKCAADLKSRTYEGPEWLDGVTERVKFMCLQDNGYYKAVLTSSAQQLPDKHGWHEFIVTFDINAGPQYRFGEIVFKNNRVFSAEQLRSMFKFASGDVSSPFKLRQGFEQMRSAYVERHYLNFTAIPEPDVDDSIHVINMVIDCDEGKQVR